MRSAFTKWTLGVAVGLFTGAVAIAMTTEQAWADSCSGATIAHSSADCLTAVISNGSQTLSLTNACSNLGVVAVEVKTIDEGGEGTVVSLQVLFTASTVTESTGSASDATYTNARCCPASGICAITDCDTTDGVINDYDHADHCHHIDATTGAVFTAGNEITHGVLTYTPPPPAD